MLWCRIVDMLPETPWTDVAAVYIAAIVAVITLVYVILTYKLAEAARRQLSSQMMPPLRVQIQDDPEKGLTLILANHGVVSAYLTQVIVLGPIDDADMPFDDFKALMLKDNADLGNFSLDGEGWYFLRDKLLYDHIPPQTQVTSSLIFPTDLVTNGVTVWLQYTSTVGEVFGQKLFLFPVSGRNRYSAEANPAIPIRQHQFHDVPYSYQSRFQRIWNRISKSTGKLVISTVSRRAPRYLGLFRNELNEHSISVGLLRTAAPIEWADRGDWTLVR